MLWGGEGVLSGKATRKVRGGELFWGGVALSRGIVGALLRRSRAFSGVLSHSQSIARLHVIPCRLAVPWSRKRSGR